MTDLHPITTPPFELINQWQKKACKDPYNGGKFIESKVLKYIATAAAQWGADQELDACCLLLDSGEHAATYGCHNGTSLRAARRPKPLSEADLALNDLKQLLDVAKSSGVFNPPDNIRRCLERLKKLEELTNDRPYC